MQRINIDLSSVPVWRRKLSSVITVLAHRLVGAKVEVEQLDVPQPALLQEEDLVLQVIADWRFNKWKSDLADEYETNERFSDIILDGWDGLNEMDHAALAQEYVQCLLAYEESPLHDKIEDLRIAAGSNDYDSDEIWALILADAALRKKE